MANDASAQYQSVCQSEFKDIKDSLIYVKEIKGDVCELKTTINKIDEAIRGNGAVGIKTEIAILKLFQANIKKFLWIIATALVGLILGIVKLLIFG